MTASLLLASTALAESELHIVPEAASEGTLGLEVVMAACNSATETCPSVAYVEDESPYNETHYRASYSLRIDSADMGANDEVHHLVGYAPVGLSVLRVGTSPSASGPVLFFESRELSGYWIRSPELPLPSGWNRIDLEWSSADPRLGTSGRMAVSLNSGPQTELLNLANEYRRVEYVRLGAVAGSPISTTGLLEFDDFSSYRGDDAPVITQHPNNLHVPAGWTAQFQCLATSGSHYAWESDRMGWWVPLADEGNVSGATTNTLTLSNVQLADSGWFRCVAAKSTGSRTSNRAALTVGCGGGLAGPLATVFNDNFSCNVVNLAIHQCLATDTEWIYDYAQGSGSGYNDSFTVRMGRLLKPGGHSDPLLSVYVRANATLSPHYQGSPFSPEDVHVYISLYDGDTLLQEWERVRFGAEPETRQLLVDPSVTELVWGRQNIRIELKKWHTSHEGYPHQLWTRVEVHQIWFDTPIGYCGGNRAPVAVISSPAYGSYLPIGEPILFDATVSSDPDGDPITCQWSFGDGGGATGSCAVPVSHTYAASAAGTGTVALVVSDGDKQTFAYVDVLVGEAPDPAIITSGPTSVETEIRSEVTFSCQATGTEPLQYAWFKDSSTEPLTDGGQIAGSATSTLTISNVMRSDQGEYTCQVSSPFGAPDSASAQLTVTGPDLLKKIIILLYDDRP